MIRATSWYGAAVDYGSTTLVMQVVDLLTGKVLTEQSIFNRQIPYGEEILSRIFYTKDDPEHLKELQQVTADSFNELIEKCEKACGIPGEAYTAMTIGGNTTMIHFLLGLYPWPIFETPYAPVAGKSGISARTGAGHSSSGLCVSVSGGGELSGRRYHQRSDCCQTG